jgi:hypothetical protein
MTVTVAILVAKYIKSLIVERISSNSKFLKNGATNIYANL